MARGRRASATVRLNLEIAGIAALGVALLLAVALALPASSGAAGAATAHGLVGAVGAAAWVAPLVVAFAGAIVFLEINVPRMIATFGIAALLYFAIVDAAFGRRGGAVGTTLARGLHALVGDVGSAIVLVLAALVVTVWITRLSVKRAIGWSIVALTRARNVVAGALRALRPVPARAPSTAIARPGSLREAFGLPPIAPVDVRTFVAQPAAPATPAVPAPAAVAPAARVQPDDEGDFEGDEDEDLDDDVEDDDEEFDDGDFEGDDEEDDEDETVDRAAKPVVAVTPVAVAAIAAPAVVHAGARQYRLPDLALFDPPQVQHVDESTRSHVLEDTLASFGVGAKVVHIERGPSITRYELRPERGVKISRISSLADDIALALAATAVRIEAPIPGKSAVGIEVPNATVSLVAISEILQALPLRGTVPPLHMALGKDITGRPVFGDLAKMPHLLVAGATGSGKSVCLNGIVASVLASATPDQVQMLFIDPKRVELTVYNGIPHLIEQVITDPRLAAGALFQMTKEMDSRYERFARAGVRKIEEYNAKYPDETLPYVIILIDELADLMMIAPGKVETTICRIAQLARATGIHLVVATQRPSVDVITGIIKANIPSRIAFAVSSQVDSRTILDMAGAERLLGRGDMLYLPIDAPKPVRAQGALITGGEGSRLVEFWARQSRPHNLLDVEVVPMSDDEAARKETDPLCYEAAKFLIETNYASTAALQSRFSIGHPRAMRLMKQLEDFKVVGQHEGTKPRKILIGLADLEVVAPRLGKTEDAQQDLFASSE